MASFHDSDDLETEVDLKMIYPFHDFTYLCKILEHHIFSHFCRFNAC